MVAPREIVSDGLRSAICQQHTRIIPVHGISNGGLHTDARGATRDDQVFDPLALEYGIQFGFVKATETVFVKNNVLGHCCKFRKNVSVPCLSDQHATRVTGRCLNRLANTKKLMP